MTIDVGDDDDEIGDLHCWSYLGIMAWSKSCNTMMMATVIYNDVDGGDLHCWSSLGIMA